MGTSLSRSGIGCCRELISLRLHIIDRRARSQRSATSASSINVPEFDVMLREAAWAVPAVLPELLEERLAIGLIELAPPAWVCLHDVRRLPRTTLAPLRTKARTELPRALAQACLKHGNPAEVVSRRRHRFG